MFSSLHDEGYVQSALDFEGKLYRSEMLDSRDASSISQPLNGMRDMIKVSLKGIDAVWHLQGDASV